MAGSEKVLAATVSGFASPNCWMARWRAPGSMDLRGRVTSTRLGLSAGFHLVSRCLPVAGVESRWMSTQAVPVEVSRRWLSLASDQGIVVGELPVFAGDVSAGGGWGR